MAITGKQRSRRIDRGYTSAVDPSILWKRRLGWGCLILGIVYGMWFLFPSSAKQMSAGPLSKAHHAWNETGCENCHAPWSPIKTTSVGRTPKVIADNNQRCNACHQVQDHYPAAMKPDKRAVESCVQCHHEHLGFNHNLLDVADESCVRCHKDLSSFALDANKNHPKITSFDFQSDGTGHPAFASLAKDEGTIHFSHIQHMRPGQPAQPNDRSAKSFASLSPRFKEQYRGRELANGLIQLDCSDCHSISKEGGLYQPVEFDKHCQACHELDVPHRLDLKDVESLKDTIQAAQWQQYSRLARSQNTDANIAPSDDRLLREKSQQSASGKNILNLLNEDPAQANTEIFKTYGCGKCHQPSSPEITGSASSKIVQDSRIQSQWLKYASFDHSDHANVQCYTCHQMELDSPAKPNDPNPPLGGHSGQVLIGGVDNCRTCHIVNEADRSIAKNNGEVRVATADCIDCHRYHHDPNHVSNNSQSVTASLRSGDLPPSDLQGPSP